MTTQIITNAVAGPFRAMYAGPGLSTADSLILAGGALPTGAHLGVIGAGGIRLIRKFEGEDYSGDLLGNSIIESVYLGGQMFLEFELEEANLGTVLALTNPFSATAIEATPTVDMSNEVGIPGTFMTSKAGSICLQPLYAVSGTGHTTAADQVTPCRVFGLVTLAAGFEREMLLSSKRRVIPVRLRCYPYLNTASDPDTYVWYHKAAASGTYFTS